MTKSDAPQLTPIMQQYKAIKARFPDCLLFFRLGDFYEMFYEDAETGSRELELTLTARNSGAQDRAPMCGVPHHAAEGYISRLLGKGYKVALCEQMVEAGSIKGIIPREVVRVFTPGTVIESGMLDENRNNYIVMLLLIQGKVGLCAADISTGEVSVGELPAEALQDELHRLQPSEILASESVILYAQKKKWKPVSCPMRAYPSSAFSGDKAILSDRFPGAVSLTGMPLAARAATALIHYLDETQRAATPRFSDIQPFETESCLLLDAATRRNLELTQTLSGRGKVGSLLWVLDRTSTSMGSRQLRAWIEQPMHALDAITWRQDLVEALISDFTNLCDLQDRLKGIYDIERLTARLSYGTFNARDALALGKSLSVLPDVRALVDLYPSGPMKVMRRQIDPFEDLAALLGRAIVDEPAALITEGGMIREGYDEELDRLRTASTQGMTWIAELEAREREETGIKNLKIGYNRVFGYYIEVTKSNYGQVPYRYTRKQTLANCERFITQELKDIEETVLGAQERAIQLEHTLFLDIRQRLTEASERLLRTADALKKLDALASMARVSIENRYVRPKVYPGMELIIESGRHPVVERMAEGFVENDTHLTGDERLMIITGPNMAGKSTYMRQVALIVLMAHMGCFVPAARAVIPLTDRICTRVGASDDLSMGQSTFMVEMTEMANILRSATRYSLLLIDEIGRGTSTFDGLSIAWSVAEYLCDERACGAKTLFATHFHELSELEGRLPGAVNYSISAKEQGEDILFLRRVQRGGTDKSYGIQVARLAGLPGSVIQRARRILAKLEAADINRESLGQKVLGGGKEIPNQIDLLSPAQLGLIEEIKDLSVEHISPMEALQLLYTLHEKAVKAR